METIKLLGSYLIRYAHNRVFDIYLVFANNHEAVYRETCLNRSCSRAENLLRRTDTFDPICFLYTFLLRISKAKNCKEDTAGDG